MFEDDENEDYEFESSEENQSSNLNLYTAKELCEFVKETLEKAHGIKITNVELDVGFFTFDVAADDKEDLYIPFDWKVRKFGKGVVTFEIGIDVFQHRYNKFEERDLIDTAKAMFKKVHGDVCEVVSVQHMEEPMFEDGVELIARLKKGCKYVNEPWLNLQWVKGDLMCFEVGEDELHYMMEA